MPLLCFNTVYDAISMNCGNGLLYHYNSFGWLLLSPHLFIGSIHVSRFLLQLLM